MGTSIGKSGRGLRGGSPEMTVPPGTAPAVPGSEGSSLTNGRDAP
jgi:hypothetical protein